MGGRAKLATSSMKLAPSWLLMGWLASAAACSGPDRPGSISSFVDADGSSVGGADASIDLAVIDGPPPPDASGYCGNTFFHAVQEAPSLYFVLDRSGSMQADSGQQGLNRYQAVRVAVVEVVRRLGNRANFGAAVLPGRPLVTGCETGFEVFKTRTGDVAHDGGADGPVTRAFAIAIDATPQGGTPLAATLERIRPTLVALSGKTAVVLATDGGPNCNPQTTCTAADCVLNIEKASLDGVLCTPSYNCCSAAIPGAPAGLNCVDSSATIQAIQKLHDAGIQTYIVGIPGSSYYSLLLDQLATAGGSARASSPRYYRVDDMSQMSDTLLQIGTRVLITCDFVLDAPPPDPGLVNVYLDRDVVAYDPTDGWTWTGESTLALHGQACQRLENGLVAQVQVVAGCPTELPK
jgi:hypothetical protein